MSQWLNWCLPPLQSAFKGKICPLTQLTTLFEFIYNGRQKSCDESCTNKTYCARTLRKRGCRQIVSYNTASPQPCAQRIQSWRAWYWSNRSKHTSHARSRWPAGSPSIPRVIKFLLLSDYISRMRFGTSWVPVYADEEKKLACMSIGFLLANKNDSVVWRGPKKTGMSSVK